MRDAVARAATYSPSPKTVWVARLLRLLKRGVAVFEEALAGEHHRASIRP